MKPWSELTPTEVYALSRLRTEVFLREQGCDDEELDWRDLEPATEHYLLTAEKDDEAAGDTGAGSAADPSTGASGGTSAADPSTGAGGTGTPLDLVAYLRILRNADAEVVAGIPTAHLVVGRVVTDPGCRGRGLASRLLAEVIARHGDEPLMLHAQTYAAQLYAKAGFQPVGEIFDEAGIPHITMVRPAD